MGSPTWGWLSFALKLGETILKDKNKVAKKVRTPVTVLCSGDDHLIAKQPSKAFAKKLGKATYVEIAGAEHEILIEAEEYRREAFIEFDKLMDFVAARDAVRAPAPEKVPPGVPDEALDEVAMAVADTPAGDDEHLPETEPDLTPDDHDTEKRA